jgi:hypothetical protein
LIIGLAQLLFCWIVPATVGHSPIKESVVSAENEYRAPIGPHASAVFKSEYYQSSDRQAFRGREKPERFSEKFTGTKILSFFAGLTASAKADKCARQEMLTELLGISSQPRYVLESRPMTESYHRYMASKYSASEIVDKYSSTGIRKRIRTRRSSLSRLRCPEVDIDDLIDHN